MSRRSSASGSFTRSSSLSVGGGFYVGHDSELATPLDHALHRRKLSVSHTAVMTVWAKLDAEEQLSTSNDTIHRFLRASAGDADTALKRLRSTIRWRKAEQADSMMCSTCLRQDGSHYMHVVGHDYLRRPVLYSCLAMPKSRSVEENRRHMIATFEQAVRSMPTGVEQWVWIADFHGFGLKDTDPRLAKIFLDVSAGHYPERLGLFYCVDAPGIFNMLWKCIQGRVDPVTRAKVKFLPYDVNKKRSALAEDLGETLGEDLQQWLLREMAQNRSRKVAKRKVYPAGANFLTADDRAKVDGHDVRGTDSFIVRVKKEPTILIPAQRLEACQQAGKKASNAELALL